MKGEVPAKNAKRREKFRLEGSGARIEKRGWGDVRPLGVGFDGR